MASKAGILEDDAQELDHQGWPSLNTPDFARMGRRGGRTHAEMMQAATRKIYHPLKDNARLLMLLGGKP